MTSENPIAAELCREHSELCSQRAQWDNAWYALSRYVQPRKNLIQVFSGGNPDLQQQDELFDNTAIESNMTLAAGCLSWLTPAEMPWFAFEPIPEMEEIDPVKSWLSECTEIVARDLASSNFYTQIHEQYLDRGCFGTGLMFCEAGKDSTFHFDCWDVGTYSIAENSQGIVDTVFREFALTARQALEYFGEDALDKKLREKANDPVKQHEECKFLHVIRPRKDRDTTLPDAKNMPYACYYVHIEGKTLIKESGYSELPFFASRYLKWGDEAYGYGPGFVALADAKQLNVLQRNLDVLSEVSAFPRIRMKESFTGTVDLRAGGVTVGEPGDVEEWATQGRYDIGLQRVEMRKDTIKSAFHVDTFKMFQTLERNAQMTTVEVRERAQEKLELFSPTFAQMTTELFNPLLTRLFALSQRQGKLPPPPQEAVIDTGDGSGIIPFPKVTMTSRLALALRAIENSAFRRTMAQLEGVAQVMPSILDNFRFDDVARDIARNEGMSESQIEQIAAREQKRKERAEEMAKQQAMEAAGAAV